MISTEKIFHYFEHINIDIVILIVKYEERERAKKTYFSISILLLECKNEKSNKIE